MKKRDIVKSKLLFDDIIHKGNKISNKYYIVYYNNKDEKKFGLAVGKKIGSAVMRNKIKRQLRNIIDNNYDIFPNNYNYIIIVKKEILNLKYHDMENELVKLLKEKFNEK